MKRVVWVLGMGLLLFSACSRQAAESGSHRAGPYVNLTESNFDQEVLESSQPVFVDFWATWCGPCKQMAPAIEEMAADLEGQIKVAKLDIDANENLANKYAVTMIPAYILFKDGKAIKLGMGVTTKADLVAKVNEALHAK